MTDRPVPPWESDPGLMWETAWIDLPELATRWETFVRQFVPSLPLDVDVAELRIRRSTGPQTFRAQVGFRLKIDR